MLVFILLLLAGSVLAYVSQFNLTPVSVNLVYYQSSSVPLFFVIIGSFVAGLLLSYLVILVKDTSAFFVLRGKKKEIRDGKDEVLELTKRVHQLELENEKLKQNFAPNAQDKNAL